MKHLLSILLLQLVAVSAPGQSVHRERPASLPKQPAAMVRRLYRQVVARHPLGLPSGENWKVFAPYLSKGLRRSIDLARSCADDYVRQDRVRRNQGGLLEKAPIEWAELGLFSGDEELADPLSFQIERTEPKQDNSSDVYVRLIGGAPPEKPWKWEVEVRVVMEDGNPVVDDVIFLKGEGVSYESRLSEILVSGCDGPRWVGDDKQKIQPK